MLHRYSSLRWRRAAQGRLIFRPFSYDGTSSTSSRSSKFTKVTAAVAENNTTFLWETLERSVQEEHYRLTCFIFNCVGRYPLKSRGDKLRNFRQSLMLPYLTKVFNSGIRIDTLCMIQLVSGMQHYPASRQYELDFVDSVAGVIERSFPYHAEDAISFDEAVQLLHGVQHLSSDRRQVRRLLVSLRHLLSGARFPTKHDMTSIARLMRGLRGLSSDHVEVIDLLPIIERILHFVKGNVDGISLSMILSGLRNLSSDHQVVRDLIRVLKPIVEACKSTLSPSEVARVLSSFANLKSNSEEVVALLTTVLPLIKECQGPVSQEDAIFMLEGLSGLSSDEGIVLQIVSEVTRLISSTKIRSIGGHRCAVAVRSLEGFTVESPEVRNLIRVLIGIIHNCPEIYSQEIARIFFTFRGFSADSVEIRGMIVELTKLLSRCSRKPISHTIATVMMGIRSFSSDVEEVGHLVSALAEFASRCNDSFSAMQCARVMQGMRCLRSSHPSVRKLMREVKRFLGNCSEAPDRLSCAMLINGLRSFTSDFRETVDIIAQVTKLISRSPDPQDADGLALIMQGLSNLNGEFNDEILHLIFEVHRLFQKCDGDVSAKNVPMLMNGLKGLSHYPECIDLVAEVTRLLKRCSEPINCQQAAIIMHVLQHLPMEKDEVIELLIEVRRLLSSCDGNKMNGFHAANMVSGLKRMKPSTIQEVGVIKEVSRLLRRCDQGLNKIDYFMIINGIQVFKSNRVEVKQLLHEIWRLFSISDEELTVSEGASLTEELLKISAESAERDSVLRELNRLASLPVKSKPGASYSFKSGQFFVS